MCKCGTGDSCKDQETGAFCDAANNICKCAENVDACTGGETCDGGACKCGTANSCKNQRTGEICDAGNNVCKCAPDVDACNSGEFCTQAECGA